MYMTAAYRKKATAGGFSLLELTIALVVLGLLLGMLAPALSAQMERRQNEETRLALAAAEEALLGFAVATGRLPRPARSATDGEERDIGCASDADCTGFLPWQTLGVRRADAWGKLIRYSVTPAYANGPFTLQTTASKKIQTRDIADNLVYLVGSASSCASSPCAAAVIYSPGRRHWGTFEDGNAAGDGSDTNLDEDSNEAATTRFIARGNSAQSVGGEFDDIVTWLPTAILVNRMVSAGRLP